MEDLQNFKYIVTVKTNRLSTLDDFDGCSFLARTFDNGYYFATNLNSDNYLVRQYKEFLPFIENCKSVDELDKNSENIIYSTCEENACFSLDVSIRPIEKSDIDAITLTSNAKPNIDVRCGSCCYDFYDDVESSNAMTVCMSILEYIDKNILMITGISTSKYMLCDGKFQLCPSNFRYRFPSSYPIDMFANVYSNAITTYWFWDNANIKLDSKAIENAIIKKEKYTSHNFHVCSDTDRKFMTKISITY
jgi:hypothetical protein